MNGVLLISLVGPMQSWGTRSRFQERDTEREPSKSGVIGLLCAALGRNRSEPVADLAALKMGVRADREGHLSKDFQTAQEVAVASGGSSQAQISNRHYLADAAFLVGLEGVIDVLNGLHTALLKPVWPLFLGRKSYVPSLPPYLPDGICMGATLRDSILKYPLSLGKKNQGKIRLVLESATATHESRMDTPVSFALGRREFRERFVKTELIPVETFSIKENGNVSYTTYA